MRRRTGAIHVAIVMLAAAVVWILLRANMYVAVEEAHSVRRVMDHEQVALLLDSAERIVARRAAAGHSSDSLELILADWGRLAAHRRAADLDLIVTHEGRAWSRTVAAGPTAR